MKGRDGSLIEVGLWEDNKEVQCYIDINEVERFSCDRKTLEKLIDKLNNILNNEEFL